MEEESQGHNYGPSKAWIEVARGEEPTPLTCFSGSGVGTGSQGERTDTPGRGWANDTPPPFDRPTRSESEREKEKVELFLLFFLLGETAAQQQELVPSDKKRK